MVDFLDEVIEDVKHDKFRNLANQMLMPLIWLAVLVVIGTAVGVWIKEVRYENRTESGNQFFTITKTLEVQNIEEDIKSLTQIVRKGSGAYQGLAALSKANLLVRLDNDEKALALYDVIAETDSNDISIRDMAVLLASMHRLNTGQTDNLNEALEPLTGPERPWRFTALELQAMVALKMGDNAKAISVLQSLRDDGLSPLGVRSRANIMLTILNSSS